jgi:hypothetical protein
VNSVAARRSEQLLYLVYLARVIGIQAVQCYREAVTDDYTLPFFGVGCRPGRYGDFQWSLDAPEALLGPVASAMNPVSLPMQLAWNAAVVAFKEFIAAIVNGELIASGMPPATGVRCDLEPAEWTRSGLILDVINGDLIDGRYSSVRWSNIKLREAKQPGQKKKRGHGYPWEGAWAYATSLRAEDQWDWTHYPRHKKQPLPAVRKIVEKKIAEWFEARGNVPHISDIRRNIVVPLYAGRRTRGKRKR